MDPKYCYKTHGRTGDIVSGTPQKRGAFRLGSHNALLWLSVSGARGYGNKGVFTFHNEKEHWNRTDHQWTVRSSRGNGTVDYEDPRKGECLEYNDKIFLQNNFLPHLWCT